MFTWLFIYLFIYLLIYLNIYSLVYLFVCLFICLFSSLFTSLFTSLFVYLFICLLICLFIYLFIYSPLFSLASASNLFLFFRMDLSRNLLFPSFSESWIWSFYFFSHFFSENQGPGSGSKEGGIYNSGGKEIIFLQYLCER